MSLKAGRVGVNPADVDPISGHISPEASDSYTKAQADEKFLSKSDASSTYESKSDASTAHNALQPKTLAVPIEMLSGTKLTVETALEGLNSDKQNVALAVPIEMLSGTKLTVETALQGLEGDKLDDTSEAVTIIFDTEIVSVNADTYCKKMGKLIYASLSLGAVTVTSDGVIGVLPEGCRPSKNTFFYIMNIDNNTMLRAYINNVGQIRIVGSLSVNNLRGFFVFVL